MDVICASCGRSFTRNPRNPRQSYCSRPECQRMRKALWQKNRMKSDAAYRDNQRLSWREWSRRHRGYWKEYRRRHPEKARRNSLMQALRNRRKRNPSLIAKMDALETRRIQASGTFYLLPLIAKMDALKVNIYEISGGCP